MIKLPDIFSRIMAATQALRGIPSSRRGIIVPQRRAGVFIDDQTALTFSAYFRGIAYISASVAGLPWDVMRELNGKKEKRPQHPVFKLLHTRPNPEMNAFTFREVMIAWAISWGNGYAEIERDQTGRPLALWPISPDRVTPTRLDENGQPSSTATGPLVYEISNYTTEPVYIPAGNIYHVHGLGWNGLQGYSIVTLAARSLGIGIAAEQTTEDFLSNGAVSTGGLKHPQTLSDKAHKRLKEQLEGKALFGHKWRPMLLEEGMEWFDIAIPSKDAQMIETRKLQVTDIARWMGLPPHKLMDLERATFSNITEQNVEVVNDAFMPWVYRLEQEADAKLLNSPGDIGMRSKLNTRGLLRGDDGSRALYYQIMRQMGVYSTNRILELEDENPVGPEGDELLVMTNQTTLKRLVAGETVAQPAPQPGAPDEPDADKTAASYQLLVQNALNKAIKRENNRFDQVAKGLKDKNDLQNWLKNFFTEHENWLARELSVILDSLAMMLGGHVTSVNGGQNTLHEAVKKHCERSKTDLAALFSGGNAVNVGAQRAQTEAQEIIERWVQLIFENRKG